MKKLFISQPMKGKTDEEILQQRQVAVYCAKAACGEEVEADCRELSEFVGK